MPTPSRSTLFLSTPSARRATHRKGVRQRTGNISIHALREEGDWSSPSCMTLQWLFLSTPSARRATAALRDVQEAMRFLSTPSARRATAFRYMDDIVIFDFYPRPPRGGRHVELYPHQQTALISIHALREEGDRQDVCIQHPLQYFYPRPPRGGRLYATDYTPLLHHFYPRPPRGGRPTVCTSSILCFAFLSTPSARRATLSSCVLIFTKIISIHALREEGDLSAALVMLLSGQFLSTPSARRATHAPDFVYLFALISIHALREEGDPAKAA